MKIALDVDEVLMVMQPSLMQFHNRAYGTDLTPELVGNYDLSLAWGCTVEESIRRINEFYGTPEFWKMMPVRDSQRGVNQFIERGHSLVALTSRPSKFKKETLSQLWTYFPWIKQDQILFSGEWSGNGERKKYEICKNLGVGLLVDDHVGYLIPARENGIRGLLFGNYPWNQKDSDGLQRVNDWEEVLRKIN